MPALGTWDSELLSCGYWQVVAVLWERPEELKLRPLRG